ncbi:hypothetical protein [Levilactobacillus zymae]|uniref:hypothetical protein n=1 Tax=Levilactobacillus zymae TaxID=267363 RepID=UPI0028BCA6FE|nr:hypothetical protein [Levilactobacillus zymae]MDT6980486.1 hypothetical protein [Levilactobacillus zymae]
MTVYKNVKDWENVGIIEVEGDTMKEIATAIRKLESYYLFKHHDYMAVSGEGDRYYFTEGVAGFHFVEG